MTEREFLFARALHQFNVAEHSPHPPGFPVFVVLTRLAYGLLGDEQRALTTVAWLFASFLAPALFYFYREIWRDRAVALAGALLGSFVPVIWAHSGMGRSDSPALVLGVAAAALALRGRDSRRALWAACVVLGLGTGVRVTVLPVAGPLLALVLWQRWRARERGLVLGALLLTGLCALSWYAPMVWQQGWARYQDAVAQHRRYIWTVDSLFAANRNGQLGFRLQRYFAGVWGPEWIMHTLYGLTLAGLLAHWRARQGRALGWLGLAFVPFMAFIFVTATPLGAPFYATPYLPLFTGLAAYGLVWAGRALGSGARWPRLAHAGFWLACALTLALAGWGYPIIRMLHSQASPPWRALQQIRQSLDPRQDLLVFDGVFDPHAGFWLKEWRKFQRTGDLPPEANFINLLPDRPRVLALTAAPLSEYGQQHFAWADQLGARRLEKLSLARYFDIYVTERNTETGIVFVEGWGPRASTPNATWRWMAPRGKVALQAAAERMTLRFKGHSAWAAPGPHPAITLRLNGALLERFTLADAQFDRTLTVNPAPAQFWSTLEIEVDNPGGPSPRQPATADDRALGLRCDLLEWRPVPGAPTRIKAPDQFLGAGWHGLEQSASNAWRWTMDAAFAQLPPIEGDAELELRLRVPPPPGPDWPLPTVEIAGQMVAQLQPALGEVARTLRVPAAVHRGQPVTLKLSVKPAARDARVFGLQVTYLGWRPVAKPW